MNYPRSTRKLTIQKPIEVTRIAFVVSEVEIKRMISERFKNEKIGPEGLSLPEAFSIDIGIDEPEVITVFFDIEN